MRVAAATLFPLLVSACAQTTRGSAVTPPAASPSRTTTSSSSGPSEGMIVRISEIQIDPNHLEKYNAILKEEAEASVRLEPGVISIFPMYQRENPTDQNSGNLCQPGGLPVTYQVPAFREIQDHHSADGQVAEADRHGDDRSSRDAPDLRQDAKR